MIYAVPGRTEDRPLGRSARRSRHTWPRPSLPRGDSRFAHWEATDQNRQGVKCVSRMRGKMNATRGIAQHSIARYSVAQHERRGGRSCVWIIWMCVEEPTRLPVLSLSASSLASTAHTTLAFDFRPHHQTLCFADRSRPIHNPPNHPSLHSFSLGRSWLLARLLACLLVVPSVA